MRTPFLGLPHWPRHVARDAIEPGERCLRSVPCDCGLAAEVVPLHDAGESLALAVPITST
jgi:hypothetical protein